MNLFKILDTKPIPTIVDSHSLGVSNNISGDYWLPVPMSLYQMELNDQIVSLHYSDILRYFETENFNEDSILKSLKIMCNNISLIATHPFLLISHLLPKSLTARDTPNLLTSNSGKFAVLRDLINIIQDFKKTVAIITTNDQTIDLLEAVLLNNKVVIKRYDGNSIKSRTKKILKKNFHCSVHLLNCDNWDDQTFPLMDDVKKFDFILVMDNNVDSNCKKFEFIRNYNVTKKPITSPPIIRLCTINSIDHCKLFFNNKFDKDSKEFLKSITASTVILRDRVGVLPPDLRPIYSQNLKYLTNWIEDPTLPWPLPDTYPIKDYNSFDIERSLLKEVNFKAKTDLDTMFTKKKNKSRPNSNFINPAMLFAMSHSIANSYPFSNVKGYSLHRKPIDSNNLNNKKLSNFNSSGTSSYDSDKLNEKDELETLDPENDKAYYLHKFNYYQNRIPSFYQLKRLRNDYSQNPIKNSMNELTGIFHINNNETNDSNSKTMDHDSNYHLSSDILTHRLMQSMAILYDKIDQQNDECKMFDDLNVIEKDHVTFYRKESINMNDKLETLKSKISDNNQKSAVLDSNNKELYKEVDSLQTTLDSLLDKLKSKGDKYVELTEVYNEVEDLKEQLEIETKNKESKLMEKKYMETEIQRATDSILESNKEIETLNKDIDSLQEEINTNSKEFNSKIEDIKVEIDLTKKKIESEKTIKANLENKLSNLIEDLNDVAIPRMRSTLTASSRRK